MKRFLRAVCFVLLFAAALPARAEETAAEVPYTVSASSGAVMARIGDRDRSTSVSFSGETELTFSLSAPACGMYVIWQRPTEWTLTGDGEDRACGQNGFIHEYIALSAPRAALKMRVPAGTELCDVYFFSAGDLPRWVQTWSLPYDDCDLLVLPTHADDELLFFGGTMPLYADRGKKVQVAYLTNHWREPYRPHELLDGLWTCGVTAYPVISDFVDRYCGNLAVARERYGDGFLHFQIELIRRFRPEVIVGHDLNGEYGHGAHILNAVSLVDAVQYAADPDQDPETAQRLGVWQTRKLYLHLYPENTLIMPWDQPISFAGGKTAYQVACDGYDKHVSQHYAFRMTIGNGSVYDCSLFGLAYTTVGPDEIKNDFFEHISLPETALFHDPLPQVEPRQITRIPYEPGFTDGEGPYRICVGVMIACGVLLAAETVAVTVSLLRARKKKKGN